eukprot:1196350-Prorocentrum_minimum.AAC.7
MLVRIRSFVYVGILLWRTSTPNYHHGLRRCFSRTDRLWRPAKCDRLDGRPWRVSACSEKCRRTAPTRDAHLNHPLPEQPNRHFPWRRAPPSRPPSSPSPPARPPPPLAESPPFPPLPRAVGPLPPCGPRAPPAREWRRSLRARAGCPHLPGVGGGGLDGVQMQGGQTDGGRLRLALFVKKTVKQTTVRRGLDGGFQGWQMAGAARVPEGLHRCFPKENPVSEVTAASEDRPCLTWSLHRLGGQAVPDMEPCMPRNTRRMVPFPDGAPPSARQEATS